MSVIAQGRESRARALVSAAHDAAGVREAFKHLLGQAQLRGDSHLPATAPLETVPFPRIVDLVLLCAV